MQKLFRFLDRTIDYCLFLFFLLLFIIGGYTMYDTVLVYASADGDDLKTFRPLETEDGGVLWDMSLLSEDTVAWLIIDDTNIDYPVMQGKDNNEYLNKTPLGEYSMSGSIFLDSRNDPKFTDPYSLVYGHHMEYGKMFGALDDFMDEAYFDAHTTGTLTVDNTVYHIKLFACVEADASVDQIFAPTEVTGTLPYVREHADVFREPAEGNLIAFSTCKYPETTIRIILFGVLT